MIIADMNEMSGRTYPARRRTRNLVGGASPIKAEAFAMGHVTLEAGGGQVPWHNHPNEEVYFVIEGRGEICVGAELAELRAGQAVYIPGDVYHQISNIGEGTLRMIYVYAPGGDVSHWQKELDGTLPRAGREAPPLPEGAREQFQFAGDDRDPVSD